MKLFDKRKEILHNLKQELAKELRKLPKGRVKARKCRNAYRYYYYDKENSQKFGKYIGKKDEVFLQRVIQNEYDEKLMDRINEELKYIEQYEQIFDEKPWESIKKEMHEEKRMFISNLCLSEEEIISEWKNCEFQPLGFKEGYPNYYTKRGLRVRSKTEIIIADTLDEYDIPYIYEKPIELYKGKIVYPDFTILDVENNEEIYWEHLGMMDDLEYRNHNFLKLREYEEGKIYMGINLMVTFETSKLPINTKTIRNIIKRRFVK